MVQSLTGLASEAALKAISALRSKTVCRFPLRFGSDSVLMKLESWFGSIRRGNQSHARFGLQS